MSDRIVHTSDASFDSDVLQSAQPVLLDFWAEWCAPCKAIAPVLEEIAETYDGRVRVAKLDVAANPEVARKYQVRSIPTLMLFNNGAVEAQIIGAQPKADITAFLDAHI